MRCATRRFASALRALRGLILCPALCRDDGLGDAPPFEELAPLPQRSSPIYAYSTSSVPLAGTPRFHRIATYTGCLRCAGAPRRPTIGSVLSLFVPYRHAAPHNISTRHSHLPHHPLPMGNDFGASLIRYPLRPADLLASLADLTGLSPSQRRLLPSFQRVGHPSRCRA